MVPKQAKVAMMIEITKEAKITTNISSLTKHVHFATFQNMYMYTRLTGHSWIDHVHIWFASPHQCTPLHWAASGGHVDTVTYLVVKGANIHSKDDDGVSE